ncbi:hypothetical protein ACOMHN_049792 [Nucella lapillus]
MASRKESHKMKSAITDERKKRLLRVHRRSLDQREMRQEEINKRRQIDDMSPVIESQEASKNPSAAGTPVTQNAGASRLVLLKKWKEERELKRKLEAMERAKSKPGFIVKHLNHNDIDLYNKMKAATAKTAAVKQTVAIPKAAKTTTGPAASAAKTTTAKPSVKPATKAVPKTTATKRTAAAVTQPEKKPAAAPVTRTTRSRETASAKTVSPVASKKAKKSPAKRGTKPNFMAPTASSQTRTATGAKKEVAPQATTTQKRRGPARTVKDTGKVSTRRGGGEAQSSFAPSNFEFEAPSNLASFVFKPLSPTSSAGFLYPQGNTSNTTTISSFTQRVGRTSTPKGDGPPPSSSEDDVSDEAQNKAGAEQSDGSSTRRSRSKARCSRNISADGSPVLEGKKAANKTSSTVVSDSGIEANAAGMDTSNMKTLTQESSAAASEEEAPTSEQKSSPVKSRKGRKSRHSVSKKLKAEDHSEQESETAVEAEKSVVEGNEDSTQTQPRKNKRKSKRVSIQAEATADHDDSEEQAPAKKQRRKSRKSTNISKLEAVSESEKVQESMMTTTEEVETPSKSKRSRRSAAAKAEETVQETEVHVEEKKDEQEPKSTASRRSGRSDLPDGGDSQSTKADDEAMEVNMEEGKGDQADVSTPKKSGRSCRRSIINQLKDSVENQDSATTEEKPVSGKKSVTLVEPFPLVGGAPSTPENPGHNLRGRRAKDDLFLTPGPPVTSQKRSTTKRRRTATMVALSSAKSPEEAVKIIATSPMIEMNRRTPKAKISPDQRNQNTPLVFEESDFALVPVQLSSAFDALSSDATTTDDNTTISTEVDAAQDTQSVAGSTETQEAACISSSDGVSEKRDVATFRERLSAEREKLTQLSHRWTEVLETTKDLTEEVQGQLRTTLCQAQLLMDSHKKSKFARFRGLVDKCEAGDPSTTCQDLEGFWDLVLLEVKNIYNEFDHLERLQQNNWQPDVPEVKPVSQPAKKTKKLAGPGGSKKPKPTVKSKFAAFKAQLMKQRQPQEGPAADSEGPVVEKVFDAGFFKVNSPVRTPTYHCEAGTPSKSKAPGSSSATAKTCTDPTSTPTTTSTSPKKADNKENVAHVFLRRSVGATPGRRSYVPTVPSPLLKDGAVVAHSPPPHLSPSKKVNTANNASSDGGSEEVDEKVAVSTPVRPRKSLAGRRNSRGRKSVSFVEKSQGDSEQAEDRVDLMAYLQPSSSQSNSPIQENVLEDSPFSVEDVLKHSNCDTPTSANPATRQSSGRQQKCLKSLPTSERRRSRHSVSFAASTNTSEGSFTLPCTPYNTSSLGRQQKCLKSLPTSERRRSRRSVSFAASTNTSEGSFTLPCTPYNTSSLVPGKRVSRRSLASPSQGEASPLGELKKLTATPPLRRSARPSLLYTPPKVDPSKPKTHSKNIPVGTLISFSPQDQ